ncbi:hypothetical protein BC829DRAFT_403416 [Chytridium lagenaria]|nr:hypothetical protein BC829DRAFT_403416 [Chytridium lagenaria]
MSLPTFKLFVGHLSHAVSEASLFRLFHHTALSSMCVRRMENRFGFVEFLCEDSAIAAKNEVDGMPLHGERIVVEFAKHQLHNRITYIITLYHLNVDVGRSQPQGF